MIIRRIKGLWSRFVPDADTRDFIESSLVKYSRPRAGGDEPVDSLDSKDAGVILLDYFFESTIACRYAIAGNFLRKRLGARLEYFHFHRTQVGVQVPHRVWQKVYESFGARRGLGFHWSQGSEREATEFAERVFASLRTKEEAVALEIDGVPIGDLVYDSYLRDGRHTLDLQDPLFKQFLSEAFLIFRASQRYFSSQKVRALFIAHSNYSNFGIPLRMADSLGVPIFTVREPDRAIFRLRKENAYERHPYMWYPREFAKLPPAEQADKRAAARALMNERFAGKIDAGIAAMHEKDRPGLTGYGAVQAGTRLMADSGRPRVLVMLSCFFDSPHGYRYSVFADFWEWITCILDLAAQTPFDWYVKPHPGALSGNEQVVELLRQRFSQDRYPNIRFLQGEDSNNQILAEGVSAMFTPHGTAGHEFAFRGIPVVNAGDNPHAAYGFNLHPKDRAEFERYVRSADRLDLRIDPAEVEEFVYMRALHFRETVAREQAEPTFTAFVAREADDDYLSTAVYRYFTRERPEAEREADERYLEAYFTAEGLLPASARP